MHDYSCEYILLDGPKGKYFGGNGIAFDWKYLSSFDFRGKKLILAGGLNPENVTAAIIETMPYMVDVSSGVETDGQKDLQKISLFLDRVKSVKNNYQHH
jgi:phosphoribosylanthranilate isomerase